MGRKQITESPRLRSKWLRIVGVVLAITMISVAIWYGWPRRQMFWTEIRNQHTGLHIVVFESDDWHLQGMPGPEALEELRARGYRLSIWTNYARESEEDLDKLFAVLARHRDSTGRPACITANVVMANPDFDQIRRDDFKKYSLLPKEDDWPEYLVNAYRRGIKEKVFYPQLHCLDHRVSESWLRQLEAGDPEFRLLFDLKIASGPRTLFGKGATNAADFVDLSTTPSTPLPLKKQRQELEESSRLFESVFGFRSVSLIPPFYFFDENTLRASEEAGIRYIQAGNNQCESVNASGNILRRHRYLGEPTGFGGIFLIRTCEFEPRGRASHGSASAARGIKRSFQMRTPAVVNTHSINFVSKIDPQMAELSREELDKLLTWIEKEYPDVRYLTSPELGEIIETGGYRDVFTGERVELPLARESLSRAAWNSGLLPVLLVVSSGLAVLLVFYVRKRRRLRNQRNCA